jgi:hypothetical protein
MPDAPASSATLTAAHVNRHAWALEKYGHLLTEALRKDTSAAAREVEKLPEQQIPAHIVSLILEKADPTQNKGMTAWLVGQYAQGKLRLEDLGTANETLAMFRRYAQRLKIGQRDLGKYQSLAAVWEAVISFANAEEQQISGKAQKALDRDKAYAESRILRQDPDGFTIAVPLTEFAAKWWGRGTRWCTAAEKDNKFRHYHKDAPLIVVVIPELKEKGKFQIWVTKSRVQFMDAADSPVSEVLITEYWPRFPPVISFVLRQNGEALKCVPQRLRTDELCRLAVSQNGLALEYVPWDLRTEKICRLALAQNGWALEYVPAKLRTDEMYRIAVAQNGWALEHVPEDLRTEEMCRIAMAQTGYALGYVPQNLRTEKICRIAVAQNGYALGKVPQKLRAEAMCLIAVAREGGALRYVPETLRTEEMCRIAVTQNCEALDYVPEKLRSDELCRAAVTQNGLALYSVPETLRTREMCRIAVTQSGLALEHVPEDLRTEELCRNAVAQRGWALQYVPQKLRTEEMCRIAVAQDGWGLQYVPQKLRAEDICRIAVAQIGRALEYVPEHLRDRMNYPTPSPTPAWDISLLDELVSLLDATSSPVPLGSHHA